MPAHSKFIMGVHACAYLTYFETFRKMLHATVSVATYLSKFRHSTPIYSYTFQVFPSCASDCFRFSMVTLPCQPLALMLCLHAFPPALHFSYVLTCFDVRTLPRNFNRQCFLKLQSITPSSTVPVSTFFNFLWKVHEDAPVVLALPPISLAAASSSDALD